MRRPLVLAAAAGVALAIGCGSDPERPSPGGGDLPYPRIASVRLATSLDDAAREMLAKAHLAILDPELGALDADGLRAVAMKNPRMELLAHVAAAQTPRAAAPGVRPLTDARFAMIPTTAWALEPGSTTLGQTSETATRIRVSNPTAFTVARPASPLYDETEPTYVLVGSEHVRLVAIEGDELVVERGFRSTATMHPAGTRIAAHVVVRAGTWMLDVGDPAWRELMIREATDLVAAGPWSGVFIDGCVEDTAAVNGGLLDLDRDGLTDDPAAASARWTAGVGELVSSLRGVLGDDAPLIAASSADDCSHEVLDGILLEGFPTGLPPERLAFQDGLDRYLRWTSRAGRPSLSIVDAYSPMLGQGDITAMRFGLAIALMGDGYYTFDNGPLGHTVAWWYDEYDGGGRGMGWLGHPQGPPTRVAGGAYVRTFTKGMVIANPTDTAVTFTVPPGYRALTGEQDPMRNDGTEITAPLVVNARDAYLLAR